MSDIKKQVKNSPSTQLKANEAKWGKPLMNNGWTVIPNIILERQQALGLDAIDINILFHLAKYWWTADNAPHPGKKAIAEAIGLHPRTIQKRIADMEKGGLIRRQERRIKGKGSKTNLYHFDGLVKEATKYAEEAIEEKDRRKEADKKKVKSKKRPKLKIV